MPWPRKSECTAEQWEAIKAASRHRAAVYRKRTKREVIDAYGGRCACCGEAEIAFLCIDHINGGGRNERNKWASFGSLQLYRDLRARGYPPGYQVLCANCNLAKEAPGGCPHQTKAGRSGWTPDRAGRMGVVGTKGANASNESRSKRG